MANRKTADYQEYMAADLAKYKGELFPLKSGFLRRVFVRKVRWNKLHPNPDDEFCKQQVGPSHRIITEYEQKFRKMEQEYGNYYAREDPIVVVRVYPEGYMILNGHHRWAAAVQMGFEKIRVSIINVMLETDIKQTIGHSANHKRVTLDLDEVVLCTQEGVTAEKELPFPFNRLYPMRLRSGIPALFHYLENNGYDIWVYSAQFYSIEYIKAFFHKYHVHVSGIVTGTEKRTKIMTDVKKKLDELVEEQYHFTLHIDNKMVLQSFSQTHRFEEHGLKGSASWAEEVKQIIEEIDRKGEIDQNG